MGKVVRRSPSIDPRTFDAGAAIREILPRGHAIHGYSSGDSTRLLMVLETSEYDDEAPLLGWGTDGKAEIALARALLTYALRERDGLTYIEYDTYGESTNGQVPPGRNDSKFDNIVWGSGFKLYEDGRGVVAGADHGGGPSGLMPFEVVADDPLAAIEALTNAYKFFNPTVARLPAIILT